jgi:hypothetical protein
VIELCQTRRLRTGPVGDARILAAYLMTADGRADAEAAAGIAQEIPPRRLFTSSEKTLRCVKILREHAEDLVPETGKVSLLFGLARGALASREEAQMIQSALHEAVGRAAHPGIIDRSDDELDGDEETDIDIDAAAVMVTTLVEELTAQIDLPSENPSAAPSASESSDESESSGNAAPSEDEENEEEKGEVELLYEDQIEALRARAAVLLGMQDMIRRAEAELSQLIEERLAREAHLQALAAPLAVDIERAKTAALGGFRAWLNVPPPLVDDLQPARAESAEAVAAVPRTVWRGHAGCRETANCDSGRRGGGRKTDPDREVGNRQAGLANGQRDADCARAPFDAGSAGAAGGTRGCGGCAGRSSTRFAILMSDPRTVSVPPRAHEGTDA